MFYERLNGLCQSNGITITRFAVEVLHTSNSTPSSWKKGVSPNSDTVAEIAKYFDVSADYLLGLSDAMQPVDGLTGEEVSLLDAWHAAPPVLRDAAMNVLRTGAAHEGETSSPSQGSGIPEAL